MKGKPIVEASLIPLNTIQLFFLLFGDKLVTPPWLQVFGRMHPVLLHFPIVLIIIYAVWVMMIRRMPQGPGGTAATHIADVLLLAAAFTAALTAIMGLLLSKEQGYEGASISWHKWMGSLTAFGLWGLYGFRDTLWRRPGLSEAFTGVVILIILVTGHLGGSITHGENFLLAPVMPEIKRPQVTLQDAVVYQDLVRPILESKCMSCHNSNRAKGGLVLENKEMILKGGQDGKLWDTTEANLGLLMSRIDLPPEEKKHMPPAAKPQLSDRESLVLYSWIREGASFDKKLIDLAPADTLRVLAAGLLKGSETEQYVFDAADEKKVRGLNTNYRVIMPIAKGSPALAVDFYSPAFFRPEQLKELEPIRQQIVTLNLGKMPVTDKDLSFIAGFDNLRELNLDFTKITGTGTDELLKLTKLRSLSLSGTAMGAANIQKLASLRELRHLYIWNTGMSPEEIVSLQHPGGDLVITTGFRTDTVLIKLNAPLLQNGERILLQPVALRLKHYVPGVTIRYTLDGAEPDSVTSPVYDGHVMLEGRVSLKAKAFKKGWLSSEPVSADFYSGRYRPDSVLMLRPLDSDYRKINPGILIDRQKGDLNFRSGKWMGFRKNPMECLLFFAKPVTIRSISLSSMVDIGSDILPAAAVEVWAGNESGKLKRLGRMIPEQPKKLRLAYFTGYDIKFDPVSIRYLKVIALPMSKLPDPQAKKEKKYWMVADELFIN